MTNTQIDKPKKEIQINSSNFISQIKHAERERQSTTPSSVITRQDINCCWLHDSPKFTKTLCQRKNSVTLKKKKKTEKSQKIESTLI